MAGWKRRVEYTVADVYFICRNCQAAQCEEKEEEKEGMVDEER